MLNKLTFQSLLEAEEFLDKTLEDYLASGEGIIELIKKYSIPPHEIRRLKLLVMEEKFRIMIEEEFDIRLNPAFLIMGEAEMIEQSIDRTRDIKRLVESGEIHDPRSFYAFMMTKYPFHLHN